MQIVIGFNNAMQIVCLQKLATNAMFGSVTPTPLFVYLMDVAVKQPIAAVSGTAVVDNVAVVADVAAGVASISLAAAVRWRPCNLKAMKAADARATNVTMDDTVILRHLDDLL